MPVEYVDPHGKRIWIYRASEQFARTRVGRRWGMHVAPRIDPWLYRISNGRYPVVMGMVLNAPLLTTGAKTGQPRLVHVVYFHDGADPVIIASYGGEPRNPQWYHNLKAHPECKFGDEDFIATEVTDPDEYVRPALPTGRVRLLGVPRLPDRNGLDRRSSDPRLSAQAPLAAAPSTVTRR